MKSLHWSPGLVVLAAACAAPNAPPPPSAPEKVVTAPATAPAPATKAAPEPKVTPPKAAPSPPAKPAPSAPAKPAPAPSTAKAGPAAPPAKAPAVAAAPLDLRTLEQRLKDTAAIGVLTKLSLKNQVDDLVARFKTYHAGARPPTLNELKPSFDLLLMKVLSLLQDKDAGLARDINASRESIWGVLTDRQKFAEFS